MANQQVSEFNSVFTNFLNAEVEQMAKRTLKKDNGLMDALSIILVASSGVICGLFGTSYFEWLIK